MPKPPKATPRVRHDTRNWILKALEAAGPGASLPVKALRAKIAELSRDTIPEALVYAAMKTLVKRGEVRSRGRGRRHTFALVGTREITPSPPLREAPPTAPQVPRTPLAATEPSPPPATVALLLHKLAPGEVSILHISETHVEAATNVHGKLVLERHRRPSGEPDEPAVEGTSS